MIHILLLLYNDLQYIKEKILQLTIILETSTFSGFSGQEYLAYILQLEQPQTWYY